VEKGERGYQPKVTGTNIQVPILLA